MLFFFFRVLNQEKLSISLSHCGHFTPKRTRMKQNSNHFLYPAHREFRMFVFQVKLNL